MDAARGGSAGVVEPSAEELASVDRAGLGFDALLDVVAARARVLWRVQGELLADLAQTVTAALVDDPGEDIDRMIGAVGELVGWTLHWTTGYAHSQVDLAVALARRLPMVLSDLRDGQIDQAKAVAFAYALGCVDDEVAARIATRLLPKARTWTLTQLRAALRYHVDRADPGAARRRYQRAVGERDVTLRALPDGTANLSGQGLAPHRAAAAYDRIDRIARAARASGDVRTLAQLRADALCDVLAGVPFQLSPGTDPLTAEADLSAETYPFRSWRLPSWRTEPRFPGKPGTDLGPGSGGPDDDGDPGRGGLGGADGGMPGPDEAWRDGPVPPPVDLTGVIDLYDYDRACLTDEDRAWVDIGWEPPGAAEDETPPWWPACRPAPDDRQGPPLPMKAADSCSENRKSPPANPHGSSSTAPRDPAAADSLSENRNGPPANPDGGSSAAALDAVAADSRSENWILCPEQDELQWALAQADAVHLHSVLSPDVLAGDRCACGGLLRDVRPGTVDVQVKLTTLAGLDEHPALIPGLGVTTAATARQIAFDPHTRPTWRWSIFDDDGELLHHGLTRHRPTQPESRSQNTKTNPDPPDQQRRCTCLRFEPGPRRGSVELQLTLDTLHELLADPQKAPGWRSLLADISAEVDHDRRANPPGRWQQTDPHGRLLHHGHTSRMPDATEEAFVRARDRSCRAPQCSTPASRCELDHRIEFARGGPSHRGNVDVRCKRHHHLREHGHHIVKTGNTTIWTVPSGRTFTVTTDKDLILTRED